MAKKIKRGIPASKSPAYRKFIAERDRALETILNKTRSRLHDTLRGSFQRIKEKVAFKYNLAPPDTSALDSRSFMSGVESEIRTEFNRVSNVVGAMFIELKMFAFLLASAGEAEAIGRARGTKVKIQVSKDLLISQAINNFAGENIGMRVNLAFDRLTRKLLDAVQLCRLQRSTVKELIDRLDQALPAGRFVRRPKRLLSPIKEADLQAQRRQAARGLQAMGDEPGEDFFYGFIDEETWDQLKDYYVKEYIPTYRFRAPDPDDEYWYDKFEVEQQLNHEFVTAVRSGQKEVGEFAKANGIVDYQWITVQDAHTCESCTWRDGLTTEEIEARLKGEHSDDEVDAIVPPAHPNCYCTFEPMLDTMPDLPVSDVKEFPEWLDI